MEDSSNYKLSGFLCVVLAVPSSQSELLSNPLRPGTRCHVSTESSDVCFTSENGIVLSPIESNPNPPSKDSEQCRGTVEGAGSTEIGDLTPKKREVSARGSRSSRKKRTSRMGMVHGSMSVVHQIHALVVHKCLKIDARVIFVDVGVDEEARAVLLVDVHLPVELWSGWQFPRSKTVAGVLFRHLR